MSGPIKVSFGQMGSLQSDLAAGVSKINGQLEDLKSFLRPLVANWDGAAAQAYNAKQAQWDTAAADLNAVLNALQNAVGQANEMYQANEARTAAGWG